MESLDKVEAIVIDEERRLKAIESMTARRDVSPRELETICTRLCPRWSREKMVISSSTNDALLVLMRVVKARSDNQMNDWHKKRRKKKRSI